MTDSIARARRLAAFAAGLRFEDAPPETIALMKDIFIDAIGCAFAADGLDPACEIVARAFGDGSRTGPCALFSSGGTASLPAAAMVNGALVHALNFDPVGECSGHTGVACVAATFAAAEAFGASGRDLLTAGIIAAEVSARLTRAIHASGLRPSDRFLSGQLLSYFGAAAGVARLMNVDAERMESALCLALMQAAGTRQPIFGRSPPAKSIYGGFPAAGGVAAAMLAAAGLDARSDLLGEPAGLYAAFYGGRVDTASVVEGLGEEYAFHDVAFKPWPASAHVIPFIEAAIAARGALGLGAIEEAILLAPGYARPWLEPLAEKLAPTNLAAAANSAPFCAAVALLRGRFDISDVDPTRPDRPDITALGARMGVRYDDTMGGGAIWVRATSNEERLFRAPGVSMSEAARTAKFASCCALSRNPAVRRNHAELLAALRDLETLSDLTPVTRSLSGA